MSAEKGWIGEPQPNREPNRSRASAISDWIKDEQRRRRKVGDTRPVTVDY